MYKRARNDQGTILDITDAQQNWLQDRWAELNQDKRKDFEDMIETFGAPQVFCQKGIIQYLTTIYIEPQYRVIIFYIMYEETT